MKTKNINTNTYFFKKIQFSHDFRTFEKSEVVEFREGINLIVGDQGCGKSSLFYSILNFHESGISADFDSKHGYLFLDTETMNPRLDNSFEANRKFDDVKSYEKAKSDHAIDSMIGDWKRQSHGQVMLPMLLAHKNVVGKTLFFDEPEAGLSIRSQHKVFDHFEHLSKNNQLFVATHSVVMIEKVKEVLSLEHKMWMSAAEFLKSQTIL